MPAESTSTQTAWRCVQARYMRRVTGSDFRALTEPMAYTGPIPVDAIVAGALLPASTSLEHHRLAWADLKQVFLEESERLQADRMGEPA